jgi:hypothetical protein
MTKHLKSMSPIDKLKRLTGENVKTHAESSAKKVQIDELRRRIDDVMARRNRHAQNELRQKTSVGKDNLQEYVAGEEIENELGNFFCQVVLSTHLLVMAIAIYGRPLVSI